MSDEYTSDETLVALATLLEVLNRALLEARVEERARILTMRLFANDYQSIAELEREDSGALPTGVQETSSGKFRARITENGELISLGVFDTVAEAHAAYRQARAKTPAATRSVHSSMGRVVIGANARAARSAIAAAAREEREAHNAEHFGDMSMPTGVRKQPNGRFSARIKTGAGAEKQEHHLGIFDTPEEAHAAYRQAHIKHYGTASKYYEQDAA